MSNNQPAPHASEPAACGAGVQVVSMFDQQAAHTLPALDQVIFVRSTRIVVVPSCATDSYHRTIRVRQHHITARSLHYRLKRGEQYVPAEQMSEALKLAVLIRFQS